MSSDNDVKVEPTILTREYKAPMQLVFEAWTQAAHIAKWQIPQQGFEFEFAYAEIEPGGKSLHKMTAPNGFEMWLLTKYEEIAPPDTIVFRQYISNENGEILPNPQMPNWPKELRTTIKLEAIDDSNTKLSLIWQPMEATQEEADAFDMSREGHDKGWGSGLDQLTGYLASVQ